MSDTPARIGPYTIERRLGAGGMAETFVAVRSMQGVEQRVCVKRILPAYARDATARRLFQREATISARLRHANLVQVLDVGEENNTPYLVMELVEGADLDHVLEQAPGRRMPADLVAYVLAEIAHGLHEAHGGGGAHEGVVHRDLSPSNVLLSNSGEVKVADFGIAKALSGDKATATMMRGKFAYMAPEQLDGAELDPRADMFALGVIGHQMLAGVRPFEADADARLVLLIAKNERKPLVSLVPDAPKDLIDVIESLLAHRKEDRPADGHVIVERLAPVLPSSTLAKRRLGKLTQAAHEARMQALATEATAPDVRGGAAALAQTVAAAPVPRPSGAPDGPRASTPITSPELAPPREGARSVVVPIALAAVAAVLVLGVGGGLYVAFGAPRDESAMALPSIAPSTVPPSEIGSPPPSLPSPSVVPPSASPTTPPSSVVIAPSAAPPPIAASSVSTPSPSAALPTGADLPAPTSGAHHDRHAHAPATTAVPTPAPTPTPPPTTVAGAAHAEPEADAHGNGTLHVVVSPWGQVWVDGRFMGRAPIDAPLRAGTHRVAAGFDHPGPERTVRIRAGQTERIELDATEE